MLAKMYTNRGGIDLLKAGYGAYVFDEPVMNSLTPFFISTKNLEFIKEFYNEDVTIHMYYASGKISLAGD